MPVSATDKMDGRSANKSGASDSDTGSHAEEDAIKLLIRVRPLSTELGGSIGAGTCLDVGANGKAVTMKCAKPMIFTFDEVADDSYTQDAIFSSVGKKIVDGCVNGYNGTIFAYGQTGSGKTFTMLGPSDVMDSVVPQGRAIQGGRNRFQHELRGIIPRCVDYLFKLILLQKDQLGEDATFTCKCSFLEIYNEQIFDLLDSNGGALCLRESGVSGVYVEALKEENVVGAQDAYRVLAMGWRNRTVAETTMNRESSRSHAVFTLSIVSKVKKNDVWNIKTSHLHLVDLAGSERQKDTNTSGQQLREASSINKSLSTLGSVIKALVDVTHGKTRHIPYRDSKLTFLLKDSLGGNSRTCIVACIHAGSRCFGETMSTLRFAKSAKMIKNKAVVNEDMQGSITQLQAEIKRLTDENRFLKQSKPVSAGSVNSGSTNGGFESGNELFGDYRDKFVRAMLLHHQSNKQKQVLEGKIRRLEKNLERQDLAIRQNKMILKFREDALKKLDKLVKEMQSTHINMKPDEKDFLIDSLRGEVSSLQTVVDRHQDLARQQMDQESMRAELQALRELQQQSLDYDELEQLFIQLQNDDQETTAIKENIESETEGPMQELQAELGIANATIARQLQQLTELQSAHDKVKKELGEEIERMKIQQIEGKAEVVAVTKAKEELERLLHTYRLRTQTERETFNDLHSKTLKILTTPRKSLAPGAPMISPSAHGLSPSPLAVNRVGFATPSRVIFSPKSPNVVSHQNGTGTPEGAGEPQCEEEENKQSALAAEIKHLQEELKKVKLELEEAQSSVVSMISEKSHVETQHSLLTQMYSSEKEQWHIQKKELEVDLEMLKLEHTKLTDINALQKSELDDLRVLNIASDRKVIEIRSEFTQCKQESQKLVEQFETKALNLTEEIIQLKAELESICVERDQLKDREETLQLTCEYTSDQLSASELCVLDLRSKNKQLEANVQVLKNQIEELQVEKDRTISQLNEGTDQKDKQLLDALSSIETLRKDIVNKSAELLDQQTTIESLKSNIEQLHSDYEATKVTKATLEEALAAKTTKLAEMREELMRSRAELSTITTELDESRKSTYELQGQCNALEERLLAQSSSNLEACGKLQQLVRAKEVEYELLDEDFQLANDRVAELVSQLESEIQKSVSLTDKNKQLEDAVALLTNERETNQSTLNDSISKYDIIKQQIDTLNTTLAEKQVELTEALEMLEKERSATVDWQKLWESSEHELKSEIERLNEKLEQSLTLPSNERHQLTSQIEELQAEIVRLRQEKERIEMEFFEQLDVNARLSGHQNRNQKISYVAKLNDDLKSARKERDAAQSRLAKCICHAAARSQTPDSKRAANGSTPDHPSRGASKYTPNKSNSPAP